MNPPSALHGAMGRERKPFTYTPGGLDLSEIKSERMAKRLMRNAMNQGVPELPPQVQSPTTPTTPIAVPNFNALPVQVFPTLNLPANPKSLLRTRSTPDRHREPPTPREPPLYKVPPQAQNTNTYKPSGMDQLRETLNNSNAIAPLNDNNRPLQSQEFNNSRPTSMYEFSGPSIMSQTLPQTSYGSDAYTAPIMPNISYDAEFCQVAPKNSIGADLVKYADINNAPKQVTFMETNSDSIKTDCSIKPITENIIHETEIKPVEDIEGTVNDDQKTVKVVKKQVKTAEKKVESETQNQNGDQNGDSEAEMIVKLPTKKSAAKTETKVEVVKKILPDGSVEETKTTITKTTIDGKTNITTKTETQIIPKEQDEVEEEEIEEEEEEEEEVVEVQENGQPGEEVTTKVVVSKNVSQDTPAVKESVVKKEERSETTTTKKVIVTQQDEEPEEVEEEEEVVEEAEPETTTVVIKKSEEKVQKQEEKAVVIEDNKQIQKQEEKVNVEVKEEVVGETVVKIEKPIEKTETPKTEQPEPDEEEEEIEEEEEYEEAEEPEDKPDSKPEVKPEKLSEPPKEEKSADEESEYTEEEIESEKEEAPKPKPVSAPVLVSAPSPAPSAAPAAAPVTTAAPAVQAAPVTSNVEPVRAETKPEGKDEEKKEQKTAPTPEPQSSQPAPQPEVTPELNVPLREPSIPLEKVEDVEIKPIGATETISKTHTEKTEIISSDKPVGTLSGTQTEYNRIENIVNVTRTTKTLDHSYEQITQQGIPTVKTYFPPGRERVSTSPQPAKPYQPFYTPPQVQPQTERRHSLLLERLSMERQMPSDIYQKQTSYQQQYNQAYEQQRPWSQEPQSEVVNDPNIKPSSITNQQWYQQSRKENLIYNNITPSTPAVSNQQWSQPQPQVHHQPPPQSQPQYQTPYIENTLHESSKFVTNSYQQSSYPSYTPAPAPVPSNCNWVNSNVGTALPNVNTQSNQYTFLNKSSSENYQNQNQQYSSSYVPPPWEQDPNYVAPELPPQNLYQPPPSTNTLGSNTGWKPTPPAGKFSKPAPKSYIPPAPNQSFVKSANANAAEPPKRPGCKTYYSEYERRYITVPESTYVPSDAKFQAQPDPTPQYYYDNNEPNETVEHQWRKELREFTEKTQTQSVTQTQTQMQTQNQHVIEQTSVHPPWEEDSKYSKVPTVTYTPTPSWSQTVRPQSMRERSFESEYVGSSEWSKTNTLGRSRPLSSYGGNNVETAVSERQRGVSVDRYNPNKYQSPLTIPYDSEHGPVQTHTLDPTHPPHRGYHNPNVPAYHTRASAEPREQQPSVIPKPSNWGGERATPIQSRSFKYLQWITGTED